MRYLLMLFLVWVVCSRSAIAQPKVLGYEVAMIPGQNGEPVKASIPITSTSCLFNLLNSRVGQAYLELTDEQKAAVGRIRDKTFTRMSEDLALLSEELGDPFAASALVTETLMREMESSLPDVLTDKQTQNLRSIRLPDLVQQNGLVGAMNDPFLGRRLKLTPEELRLLDERAKQIEAEIQKELQKLRREAIADLVESVPREKRREVELFLESGIEKQITIGLSAKNTKRPAQNSELNR